jgi:hypothetical protein
VSWIDRANHLATKYCLVRIIMAFRHRFALESLIRNQSLLLTLKEELDRATPERLLARQECSRCRNSPEFLARYRQLLQWAIAVAEARHAGVDRIALGQATAQDDWEECFEREATPILEMLLQRNVALASLVEIVNSGVSIREVADVLINWLPRVRHIGVKEVLVRGLTEKGLTAAIPALFHEFRSADRESLTFADHKSIKTLRNTILWAITVIGLESRFNEELMALVNDARFDDYLAQCVQLLASLHNPRAYELAATLLDQGKDAKAMLDVLRDSGNPHAISHIDPYLVHPDATVRKAADRALRKIRQNEKGNAD